MSPVPDRLRGTTSKISSRTLVAWTRMACGANGSRMINRRWDVVVFQATSGDRYIKRCMLSSATPPSLDMPKSPVRFVVVQVIENATFLGGYRVPASLEGKFH